MDPRRTRPPVFGLTVASRGFTTESLSVDRHGRQCRHNFDVFELQRLAELAVDGEFTRPMRSNGLSPSDARELALFQHMAYDSLTCLDAQFSAARILEVSSNSA
jgi:hypothetical protein